MVGMLKQQLHNFSLPLPTKTLKKGNGPHAVRTENNINSVPYCSYMSQHTILGATRSSTAPKQKQQSVAVSYVSRHTRPGKKQSVRMSRRPAT